uniref:DDE Tnp4 domain-containing protein n=1 Tax=Astyanax mexicanus TaxID=7994 RepID=W5KYU0_ASTMX
TNSSKMEPALIATAVGILFLQAEEEASRLGREIRQRRARVRQRMERRQAVLACLSTFVNIQKYTHTHARALKQRLFHEVEVLVTVYWLACGASYRVTADIFAIPLATVCRTVHNTVEEMMTIFHRVIHFPKPEEIEEVGTGFVRLAGHEAFRCAAGAIDGCHITILPPAEPQKTCYINRKLFPSVILQGICDAKVHCLTFTLAIQDLLSSCCHNETIPYTNKNKMTKPYHDYSIIIYTFLCKICLTGQVEARYNRHHARGRNIIERTFGILKARWRSIFLRALEIWPLFTPKVIGACCILRNICVEVGDILKEEDDSLILDDSEEDTSTAEYHKRDRSGNSTRGRLATQISAPEGIIVCLGEHDYI